MRLIRPYDDPARDEYSTTIADTLDRRDNGRPGVYSWSDDYDGEFDSAGRFRSLSEQRRATDSAAGIWLIVIFGALASAILIGWVAAVVDLWRAFARAWGIS